MKRTISILTTLLFALCQQCNGFAPIHPQRKQLQFTQQQNSHDRLTCTSTSSLQGLKYPYDLEEQMIQTQQQFDNAISNNQGGNQGGIDNKRVDRVSGIHDRPDEAKTLTDDKRKKKQLRTSSRRMFASRSFGAVAATAISSLLFAMPKKAAAGIDVGSLKATPIEGDVSGAELRKKQLQADADAAAVAAKLSGIVELESGVRYYESSAGRAPSGRNRAIRSGVQNGFNVGAIITVSTPEGLPIYSTQFDNDSNELSWKVGSGDFPRGAEEGMIGMRLGSARRIEIPSRMVFAARNAAALPEATTELGRERYEAAFRSRDAKLVFDVQVTGINPGDSRI